MWGMRCHPCERGRQGERETPPGRLPASAVSAKYAMDGYEKGDMPILVCCEQLRSVCRCAEEATSTQASCVGSTLQYNVQAHRALSRVLRNYGRISLVAQTLKWRHKRAALGWISMQ